jgi:aspartate racemase
MSSEKKLRRVGIIGGMGPLATLDLFKKIIDSTEAHKDQDHIPLLIDNYPQIEDRTGFILGKNSSPLPKLIESANRLKNAGCEAICISCNTAHYFAEDIMKEVKIKILLINEITVNSIIKNYPNAKNIAVLCTTGTNKAKIYENCLKKHNLNPVQISDELNNLLMSCIYDGVKAGKTNEFVPSFQKIVDSIDADLFIAGCTEIPILVPLIKTDKVFIDPTLELAKAVVDFSKN